MREWVLQCLLHFTCVTGATPDELKNRGEKEFLHDARPADVRVPIIHSDPSRV